MIKIVIVEDQALFREGLSLQLKDEEEICIVGQVANGEEALEIVVREKPDIVITDIQMPEMDGVELTKVLQDCYPEIKIVALTVFEEDYLIVDMLEAGASGYLLKDSGKEKLMEAIKAVHNNGRYFCDSTSMKLMKKIANSTIPMGNKEEASIFTEKEKEIIRLICEQYSSKEIGEKLHLGLKTVESYRNKIFDKAGVKNMAGLAIYAIRWGLYRI